MPVENVIEMMRAARRGGYAVGYFESWNLESLMGVIDAAEQTRSPIIVGVNGEFASRPQRLCAERLEVLGATCRAAAAAASVPCGVIFNECPDDDWVRRAASGGCFNLVMPADADASSTVYQERVAALVEHAHAHGVAVEAEVGVLPCGASGVVQHDDQKCAMTDPEVAAAFVATTGVDLLAVSVGNIHIHVRGSHPLDLRQLGEIHRRMSIPIVLHGGSGIDADSLVAAIALGVGKVNYGTYLKQRYLAAVRSALSNDVLNPHELLGMGGAADVMTAGRIAVRDAVLERIHLLNCCGKA